MPRLVRAVALLAVAVGAHVWLVRAPGHVDVVVRTEPPPVAAAEVALAPPHVDTLAAELDRVRVEVEMLRAPTTAGLLETASEPRLDRGAPAPVATTGIVLAQLEREPVEPSSFGVMDAVVEEPPAPLPVAKPEALPYVSGPARMPLVAASMSARPDSSLEGMVRHADEELRKDDQRVRQLLRDYTRAFERLDAQAAKALWPSLDDRALQKAFQQLDGQSLRFASCGVSISGADANARCRGDATYRPKVGNRVLHVTEREWTFNLSRGEAGWQIVNARVQ